MAESKILQTFSGDTMSSGDFNDITYSTMRRIDNGQSAISNFPTNADKWGTFICLIPNPLSANAYGFQIFIPNSPTKIAVRGYTKNNGFSSWRYISTTTS